MQKEKIYSLHRYIDESGAPDRDAIFSEPDPESRFKKHLNPDLMRIWLNQPEDVQNVIRFHFGVCDTCRKRYEVEEVEQGDLPL